MKTLQQKKLLMIVPFVPYPPISGGKIRVFQALKYLSKHYRVTLIAVQDPLQHFDDISSLETFCEKIFVLPGPKFFPFKLHHLRDFFRSFPGSLVIHSRDILNISNAISSQEPFEILQMEFSPLAHYGSRLPGKYKFITLHYLAEETYNGFADGLEPGFRRWYFKREALKSRLYERSLLNIYDRTFVTSEEHRCTLADSNPKASISVIENGVDTQYFQPLPMTENVPNFLFIGSLHITPANVEALELVITVVFPKIKKLLPTAVLNIVGRGLPENMKRYSDLRDIHFMGEVDDVRPYFASAKAVLLPMKSGSGTKLRIPTAMAMGRVVITTEKGLAGFECENGTHLLVENDPEKMADIAVKVALDDNLRRSIEIRARTFVEKHYDWQHIFKKQIEAYKTASSTELKQ